MKLTQRLGISLTHNTNALRMNNLKPILPYYQSFRNFASPLTQKVSKEEQIKILELKPKKSSKKKKAVSKSLFSDRGLAEAVIDPTLLLPDIAMEDENTTTKTKKKTKKVMLIPGLDKTATKIVRKYPDPRAPKAPLTSYVKFVKDYIATNKEQFKGLKPSTVLKSAANEWNKYTKDAQSKMFKGREEEMAIYGQEKAQYELQGGVAAWYKQIEKIVAEKPARSAYMNFVKTNYPKFVEKYPSGYKAKIIMRAIGEAWANLSDLEKEKLKAASKKDADAWKKKFAKISDDWKNSQGQAK